MATPQAVLDMLMLAVTAIVLIGRYRSMTRSPALDWSQLATVALPAPRTPVTKPVIHRRVYRTVEVPDNG